MNNYNNGRNRNNNKTWANNDKKGGRGDGRNERRSGGGRGERRGNAFSRNEKGCNDGERNFPKFVDMEHGNKDPDYWPQNDWNFNNRHNNNNHNFHGNNHYSNGGGGGGASDGAIFPWQRKNPLIIPPIVPTLLNPIVNDSIFNDKEVTVQNTAQTSSVPQTIQQDPSTPQRKQNENQNAFKSSTPRSRNNSTSINNQNTDNLPTPVNVDANQPPVAKTAPVAENNFTIKIKQEKLDMIKLKQERKSSSSSSSSSSEDSSSSDEEPEPPKSDSIKTPVVKAAAKAVPTKTNSPLNIKLKPQQKTTTKPAATTSTPKPIAAKKPVARSSSSSSSSSSEEDEQTLPPPAPQPKPVVKPITKIKAQPAKKQEVKGKSKKKNSSEDDVVCMGQLENKIVLEDDDDDDEDSDSEDEMEELNKSKKSDKKTKNGTKKTVEKCMICDKKGHTSFQCQMICKNCSAPYHGFRTCPHPANLNIMLQLFMEFCMQQIQNFNPDKQFSSHTTTSSSSETTVPKPQVESPSTSTAAKTNKIKRKRVKTKESITKLKSTKKRKLSNIKRRKSEEEDDDEETENSSPEEEDSADTEDSSSSSESLVSASTKRKLKNAKSKNSSMTAFNLANFIPNPVNLPMVLNGFPNLTAAPNASTPNASSNNALNTLLLTQMFQNAIGSLK